MTDLDALQVHEKGADETRAVSVDFRGKLDSGELLTGTPTVTDSASVLTLANEAVNSGNVTINGATCAAGQAVTFTVAGGVAGTDYTITVQCGTDATPAQTLEGRLTLRVV
jgi:hypothetical protein